MDRIVVDLKTGEKKVIQLTAEEEADAVTRTAAEVIEQDDKKAAGKSAHLQKLSLEALPEILAYIAAKADAPVAVKDKAVKLAALTATAMDHIDAPIDV